MADLNALIAQGAQFRVPPPVDPMGNMPQLMQMQSMQQQNQLNQMTMQEKQRGQQEMNALRRLDPSSATYLQDVKQINPKMGFEFEKMQQDAKTAGTEGQIKNVKLLADKLALLPEAYRRADTPEAYLTLHQSIHADPVVGPWLKSTGATLEKGLETIRAAVDTGKFNELRTGSMQSVSQILDSLKPLVVGPSSSVYSGGAYTQAPAAPDKAPTPPAMVAEYNFAKTPEGGSFPGSYQQFVTARAAAGRAPAQPRAESAPVAVVGDDGKIKYVSREEAITKGMTPASAQEGLPPKEIQKREAALPKSTAAIKMMEDSTDKLITQMQLLRNHPGLSGITGLIMGVTPALTSSARSAQAILDTIKAKGTLSVLTAVRNASATGGALGNTSNKDIDLLERGFGALKTTQSTNDFKTQIGNVISDLEATKLRAREAYDDTYAYKTTAPAATPINPAIDALLEKYK